MSAVKSNMELEVSFLAGTDVESAIIEAKRKAKLFNVAYIKFSFNGTKFAIGQNANVEDAAKQYLSNPRQLHICSA